MQVKNQEKAMKKYLMNITVIGLTVLMMGSGLQAMNVNLQDQLLIAVRQGNKTKVKELIKLGAQINWTDIGHTTPLTAAAFHGQAAIVQLLLEKNANVNMANAQGATPLIVAAQNGHLKIVQILLEYGANINQQEASINNLYALFYAASRGHDKIVQLLLKKGANANLASGRGETSLMTAAREGKLESVKALLTTISDIDAQAMQDSYYALLGSIGPRGINASRDVRKLVTDRFIDALVQQRIEKVVLPMIALKDDKGETALAKVLPNPQPLYNTIADLLDLDNPHSRETIDKIIKANIWQAIKTKPVSKYPATQGVSWDEMLGEFEPMDEESQ